MNKKLEHERDDSINCVNFKLNGLQCRFYLGNQVENLFVPFFGPLTLRMDLSYNVAENEVFSVMDIGSFNVTANKRLIESITRMQKFLSSNFGNSQVKYILLFIKNVEFLKKFRKLLFFQNFNKIS